MKLRHFWPVLTHSPGFVLRHGAAMLAHTFRGTSIRSLIGVEREERAFERFRAIRRREREYLPGMASGSGPEQRSRSAMTPPASGGATAPLQRS
jgi:hypothetical protein